MRSKTASPPGRLRFDSSTTERRKCDTQDESPDAMPRMWSTGGRDASSGLNGFASQPRKPHTTVALSCPPPSSRAVVTPSPLQPSEYGSCDGRGVKYTPRSTWLARRPGALDITCGPPCGNRMTSPCSRRTGGSPTSAAQHAPRAMPWNSIRCSAPGMIAGMSSHDAGTPATYGSAPTMS